MPFILELLAIGAIVFLFCIFILAKDDFILLRKNVSLEELFNISIIGGFIAVLFSRFGFAIGHPKIAYFNPLIFLAIPYFPGLSLAFGILGFCLYVFFIASRKKFPVKRMFDVMVTAFSASISIVYFLLFVLVSIMSRKFGFIYCIEFIIYGLWFSWLLWLNSKSKIRDGDTSIIGMAFVCISQLLFLSLERGPKMFLKIGFDDVVFFVEFLILLGLYIKASYKPKKS